MLQFPLAKGQEEYVFGAKCHQQSAGHVAAWVITDLAGKIIIGNNCGGHETPADKTPLVKASTSWALIKAELVTTRQFTTSQATLICAPTNYDEFTAPIRPKEVFRVGFKNGKRTFGYDIETPLNHLDEICIWSGYIEGFRPVTQDDLIKGRLLRRFVASIDTVSGIDTPAGMMVSIQCRDRMKYLSDSVSTFNTTDFSPLSARGSDQGEGGSTLDIAKNELTRSEVIMEIMRRCVGHLENAYSIQNPSQSTNEEKAEDIKTLCGSVNGYVISAGYVLDLLAEKEAVDPSAVYKIYSADEVDERPQSGIHFESDIVPKTGSNYIYTNGFENRVPCLIGSTKPSEGFNTVEPYKELNATNPQLCVRAVLPVANIITGRDVYESEINGRNFTGSAAQITDRVPVEFIKQLALQEPWPTEFFCDHRTGEYWYAPRGLDISGLEDPTRFYRTYTRCTIPEDLFSELVNVKLEADEKEPEITEIEAKSFPVVYLDKTYLIDTANYNELKRLSELTPEEYAKDSSDGFIDKAFFDAFKKQNEGIEKLISEGKETYQFRTKALVVILKPYANAQLDKEQAERKEKKEKENEKFVSTHPHPAQVYLSFREESSTLGLRSNIIVTNEPTNNAGGVKGVHLKVVPEFLTGRAYPATYYNIVDPTIGDNDVELAATAYSFARIVGKETRAASMTILGDPSLCPGELIQVIGSPLYEGESFVEDKKKVLTYYKDQLDYLSFLTELKTKPKEADTAQPPNSSAADDPHAIKGGDNSRDNLNKVKAKIAPIEGFSNAQLSCPASFNGEYGDINFGKDPKSIWRVESLIDKYNSTKGGWTTELALLVPW